MKLRCIFFVVFVLSLWAGATASPCTAKSTASGTQLVPQGRISPSSGGPGTTFTFFVRGFSEGTEVAYWATNPEGEILGNLSYKVITNDKGEAQWDWTAPRNAMPGPWYMVAQQVNRIRNVALISFEIRLGEGPPSPAGDMNVDVEPFSGTPTTVFSFFAMGFTPGERVGFWFNTPDGNIVADTKNYALFADKEGIAQWTWTPPAHPLPGFWKAVARGEVSGVERLITFEIRPQ